MKTKENIEFFCCKYLSFLKELSYWPKELFDNVKHGITNSTNDFLRNNSISLAIKLKIS